MTRRLVVFAKTPQPGTVKTRLCPPLTPDQAARVARAFLLDVLDVCRALPGHERILAYTPRGTRAEMAELARDGWRLMLQRGADLGARLENAFATMLHARATPVLVVGTDTPQLTVETLAAADAALAGADMVLGPSEDGGFYLVGLRRSVPGLLDEVRWSTEHALADTLSRARKLRLTAALLDRDYDIDELDDLLRLSRELRSAPHRLPHTRRVLSAIDLAKLARQSGSSGASS